MTAETVAKYFRIIIHTKYHKTGSLFLSLI